MRKHDTKLETESVGVGQGAHGGYTHDSFNFRVNSSTWMPPTLSVDWNTAAV